MGINLGEDAASASLQVTGTVIEKFLDLLKALLIGKNGVGKASKDKTVSTKVGKNRLNRLIKSKEDLVPLSQTLTKDQMKQWSYYAKRYGIVYSATSDKKNNEKIIILRKADLEKAVAVSEKVLENSKLKEFAEKNKDDPEFVDKVIDGYLQDTYQDMNMKGMPFNEALNRITDRDFSRDKPYYMVERNNPDNFIKLQSYLDTFKDKEYTATDYTVYKDGIECGNYSDKRFEGRDKFFWLNLKKEMKAKGGFTDDVVILNSKDEFDKYRTSLKSHVSERNEKDVNFSLNLSKEGLRDYEGLITGLKERAEIDFIQDPSSGSVVKISESEKRNIDKQIKNYGKMEQLKSNLEYSKSQFVMNSRKLETNPSDEKLMALQNELEKKIESDQIKMDDLQKIEEDLKHEESMIITNDILTNLYREEVAKRYNEKDVDIERRAHELGIDEDSMMSRAGELLDDKTKRSVSERMQEIKSYRMNNTPESGMINNHQKESSRSNKDLVER